MILLLGEVFTLGSFAGLLLITAFAPPLLVVVLVVLAIGAFLGFGLERIAFKPFRRFRDEASIKSRAMREATLLSSLAVSLIVRELLDLVFGGEGTGLQVVQMFFNENLATAI